MSSDTFPTIAEYRHPDVAARSRALQADERYLRIWGQAEQLLTDIDHLGDRGLAIRLLHDLLASWTKNLSIARGRVIHDLIYDHAYDEVGAMVGLSRQRVYEIHHEWMDRTSTQPWPQMGRWSRLRERRNAEAKARHQDARDQES